MAQKTPGQINYEGYRKSSFNKSLISGAELPTFDKLPEPIKAAWEAAATAVIEDEKAQAECGA